jgi:hypothetical protein
MSLRLDRAPFQLRADLDAAAVADDIVESFAWFAVQACPLGATFEAVMAVIGIDADDPLCRAGYAAIETIVAAGATVGNGHAAGVTCSPGAETRAEAGNAYHNAAHFCEVMLNSLYLGMLAPLERRERAQVAVAALLHDFQHDGGGNGARPFRLELQAAAAGDAYLADAGVGQVERERVRILILSTELSKGVPLARACHAKHFCDSSQHRPGSRAGEVRPPATWAQADLSPLLDDARLALQAVVLAESDLLSSSGLTVAHADLTQARLAQECGMNLGARDKLEFLDRVVGEFIVAGFFTPNLRRIRQVNVERVANGVV